MPKQQRLKKEQLFRSRKFRIALLLLLAILLLPNFNYVHGEEDDEDDEVETSDLGWGAVALFVISSTPVMLLEISKRMIRILSNNPRYLQLRNLTRDFYRSVRKPFTYIHYFAGFCAVFVTVFHGLPLVVYDSSQSITGLVSVIAFILYIVTGLIAKIPISANRNLRTTRRIGRKLHTNLIIFVIIIILHIFHVAD